MTNPEVKQWLRGPMVAVATPFTEDFALDLDALRDNVEFMVAHGVHTGQGVLLVGGAGGEHPVMSVEERKQVLKTALEAASGRVPVMTSVQHTDTRVIVDLARYAADAGCARRILNCCRYSVRPPAFQTDNTRTRCSCWYCRRKSNDAASIGIDRSSGKRLRQRLGVSVHAIIGIIRYREIPQFQRVTAPCFRRR